MSTQPLAMPITADPWGEVKDLERLHAGATRAVLQAVADLKAAAGGAGVGRPLPLVILGTAGIGKTHLFSRLRRKLGVGAILVHIQPIMNAEMAPRYVLGEILKQLARFNGGARQIDTLVGAILARGLDGTAGEAGATLGLLRDLDEPGREANLEHFRSRLLARMPDLDDGYLELLLQAPFLDTLPLMACLAWMGGKDISESQASRIGVHQPLAEDRVLPALRTLASLTAAAVPLVLVFDQLENLVQAEGRGRILGYGNLIMDLVDQVRDLVIVQMALETEWERGLRPVLSLAQQARVAGPSFTLEMPDLQIAEDLIRLWMDDYPNPAGPFPWPFQGHEVRDLVDRGATTRMLLQALKKALQGRLARSVEPQEDSGEDLLAQAWAERMGKAQADLDEQDRLRQGAPPELLADGFMQAVRLSGLDLVGSQGPERLQVATPQGELQVTFIHQTHPRSIGLALDRLGSATGPRLGLREWWRPLLPTWKVTRKKWQALLAQEGVRWHWLERQDAARLLALDGLCKAAVSRDLLGPGGVPFSPDRVEAWARKVLDIPEWGLVKALRGEPAEAVVDPMVEEPGGAGPAGEARPLPVAGDRKAAASEAIRQLRRLRVASVERLWRACQQDGQGPTRRALVADLKRAGDAVTWIGEAIVCLKD